MAANYSAAIILDVGVSRLASGAGYRRQAAEHLIKNGPQQRGRSHDDYDTILRRGPDHHHGHRVAEVVKVDDRKARQADGREDDGDDADAKDAEQRPFVARLDLKTEDHWQREDEHQTVDEDVDHRDGGVACGAVAADTCGGRVPILCDGAADQEADEDGHDEPAGLECDDNPGDDLWRVWVVD